MRAVLPRLLFLGCAHARKFSFLFSQALPAELRRTNFEQFSKGGCFRIMIRNILRDRKLNCILVVLTLKVLVICPTSMNCLFFLFFL